MAKVIKSADFNHSITDSLKRVTLNYTDIELNSNKTYNAELILASDNNYYLMSSYGRTGGSITVDYRFCNNQSEAESELEKLIKSKTKKGYTEVKLVKSDIGSEIGKSKVEINSISIDDVTKLGYKIVEDKQSTLHPQIQSLVKSWFGSIEQFVINTIDTSKCALGQLSLEQINKGRDILLEARKVVKTDSKDISTLNSLTSKYYSNIPMNFGYRKLNADELRFDNDNKLDLAFDVLDSLENAKDVEKILNKKNAVDEQYKSLNCEMEWVDPQDPVFKWIDILFHKTRAPNHHFLGKMKISNVYKLFRENERISYMNTLEEMASKNNQSRKELPSLISPIWSQRFKENNEYEKLSEATNVLPLFHGSRTENFSKIVKTSHKMRKPGFTVAGSMFDLNGGLYYGFSSKACNYSSFANSYWSGGSNEKGYLFFADVALGKQKIATGAYPYTLNDIYPCMSVWAKGGYSGVINDEFILYTENQNWLKYVIEFTKA